MTKYIILVVGVGLALCFLACSWGTLTPAEFKERYGEPVPVEAEPDEPTMFSGPAGPRMLGRLQEEMETKDLQVMEITIHEQTASLEVVTSPGTIVDYHYRNRSFNKPTKRKVGAKRTAEEVFALSSVDLKMIPELIKHAKRKLELTDAKVTQINIERDGSNRNIVIRVHLKDHTGDTDYAIFSAKGELIRASR